MGFNSFTPKVKQQKKNHKWDPLYLKVDEALEGKHCKKNYLAEGFSKVQSVELAHVRPCPISVDAGLTQDARLTTLSCTGRQVQTLFITMTLAGGGALVLHNTPR